VTGTPSNTESVEPGSSAAGAAHAPAALAKETRSLLNHPAVLYGTIGIVGLLVLLWVGVESGIARPFVSGTDSSQYASIAASVAHGAGYRDPVGLFPMKPATDRVPAWPLLMSVGMRLAPDARDEVISRVTNLICLVLSGVFMGALCRKLGVRPWLCLLGGLFVIFSPILVYVALEGLSEISFILFVTAGVALVYAGGWYLYLGAILIGLGPLVRPNFVIVPVVFAALAWLLPSTKPAALSRAMLVRVLIALCLTMVPTGLWLARNYAVTGRFPLLTTFYGEALYGSDNDGTATMLVEYWGGWVFPDYIPGETPKKELAKRLGNDVALNDYYVERGKEWVRTHPKQLPRLLLGKMVRSLALIPWTNSPTWQEWVAYDSRLFLLAVVLFTWKFWWPVMDRRYLLFLAAVAISHVITTILIDGQLRYSFCFFEIFTVPCAALGMDRWLARRRDHRPLTNVGAA